MGRNPSEKKNGKEEYLLKLKLDIYFFVIFLSRYLCFVRGTRIENQTANVLFEIKGNYFNKKMKKKIQCLFSSIFDFGFLLLVFF